MACRACVRSVCGRSRHAPGHQRTHLAVRQRHYSNGLPTVQQAQRLGTSALRSVSRGVQTNVEHLPCTQPNADMLLRSREHALSTESGVIAEGRYPLPKWRWESAAWLQTSVRNVLCPGTRAQPPCYNCSKHVAARTSTRCIAPTSVLRWMQVDGCDQLLLCASMLAYPLASLSHNEQAATRVQQGDVPSPFAHIFQTVRHETLWPAENLAHSEVSGAKAAAIA